MPFYPPFINFPPFFKTPYKYSRNSFKPINYTTPPASSIACLANTSKYHNTNHTEKKYSSEQKSKDSSVEYFFELFGIHLYFDDVLLIGLLFFLYGEHVQDDGIFICLILLLLTN